MTDHKTVREALEFYASQKAYRNRNPILDEFDPEACIHGAIHDDKGKRATEAIAAMDRIEAVETVTVEDISMCIQDWKFNEENQQTFFGDYLAAKFPNGLRIVKEVK